MIDDSDPHYALGKAHAVAGQARYIWRDAEKGAECAWCGSTHNVHRYRTDQDSGRSSEDDHTFCSNSCRKAFYRGG